MKEIIHEMIFLKNLKLIDESKTLITVKRKRIRKRCIKCYIEVRVKLFMLCSQSQHYDMSNPHFNVIQNHLI